MTKQGFPFLPFRDSLFGESFHQAWLSLGLSEKELNTLLRNRFLGEGGHSEFLFTKNTSKELILSEAPDKIRESIQSRNKEDIAGVLFSIGTGTYDHQEYPGLDVCFELLEWIMTGYEEDVDLASVMQSLLGSTAINEDLVDSIRENYAKNFR